MIGRGANWKPPQVVLICIKRVTRLHPTSKPAGGGVRLLSPDAHSSSFPPNKYYMSARHMALAKAFPEQFTYEPHEADAVSGSGVSLGGARS